METTYVSPRLSDIDSVNPDAAARATRIVFISADRTEHVTCCLGNEVLPQLFQALLETRHPGILAQLAVLRNEAPPGAAPGDKPA